MAQQPPRDRSRVSLRDAMSLMRRHERTLQQVLADEFDGMPPTVRSILARMLGQMRALIARDQT